MLYSVRPSWSKAVIKLILVSLITSTLAGLFPPPLVRSVATIALPGPLAAPAVHVLDALGALLSPATAFAASYTYEVTPNLAIPDNSPTNCAVVPITVPDHISINDLNVGLTINHPYRNNLRVTLTSPAGTILGLFSRVGGTADNFDILLDDQVTTNIAFFIGASDHNTAAPYYENIFSPQDPALLSVFNGMAANGVWTIQVCDAALNNVGTVLNAVLQIDGTPLLPSFLQVRKQVVTTDGSTPTVTGAVTVNAFCTGGTISPTLQVPIGGSGVLTYTPTSINDSCIVQEDISTLPPAPSGYSWVSAQVSPASVQLPSNATVPVTVTNTLAPVGAIVVNKQVATTDGSAPVVVGVFPVALTCNTLLGVQTSSQTVAAGSSTTFANLAPGSQCALSEDLLALPAVAGYTWVGTVVAPTPVTVVSGESSAITVTNWLAPLPAGSAVLTLIKQVNNTTNPGPYTVTVNGPGGYITTTSVMSGTPTVLAGLLPGVYTVTETSPGASWTTVYTATPGTGGSSQAVVTLENANTATLATTPISGRVFQDYNSNGDLDASGTVLDTGVSSVTVTAYATPGLAVGSAATNSTGNYTITPSAPGPYRIEFSNLPAGYSPTTHGSQNGTSTQFVTTVAGANNVNLGINAPCDYCQSNPPLVTSLQQVPPNFSFPEGIVRFNPNDFRTVAGSFGPTPKTTMASWAQVGNIQGLAWQRTTGTLFGAAYAKAQNVGAGTGLGPSGLGAIYALRNGTVSLLTTLSNVGVFTGSPREVGKLGIGGIELAQDERTLYAVNMFAKTLVMIPLTGNPPVAGTQTAVALPQPADCTAAETRPFALGQNNNKRYVGMVCAGPTTSDLRAYVYEYNGVSFTQKLNVPMNYARTISAAYFNPFNNAFSAIPWSQNEGYPSVSSPSFLNFAPMLVDIVFDKGDMVLGFRSRLSDQALQVQVTLGGEILRACADSALDPTTWTLENNGICNGKTTINPPPVNDSWLPSNLAQANSMGPGGYEYYWGDDGAEGESVQGGLAQIPGSSVVYFTGIDIQEQGFTQGLGSISHSTGAITSAAVVVQGNGSVNKANLLGGLEVLCDPAPIEIGNRVWNDVNGNGVQDPGEPGLSGLIVSGQGPTTTVTTPTDANGLYSFTNLQVNTAYTLTINVPADYNLTLPNAAALSDASVSSNNAISDTRDSDAVLVGGVATIYYTTGNAGENNHGLDFGFSQLAVAQAEILNTAPVLLGSRLWIEDDNDGDATTGTVTAVGAGHVVTATSTTTGLVYTTTTDANGYYTLAVPANDTYVVATGLPSGVVDAPVLATDGSNPATNNNRNHDRSGTTVVITTTDNLSIDFGFFLPQPSLSVIKFTNGADADTPPGPSIDFGDGVTWTYRITNTGNVTLTNITLVDSVEGSVSCPATTLAPGLGMTCSLTGMATADGQYANTALVTGTATLGSTTPVTDSNLSHYFGMIYPPTANDDEDLGNTPGTAVTLSVLNNDTIGSGALVTNTVQIVGTANAGDPLVVPGEGTWSVNLTTGAITFTPAPVFTGDPTPIQYTVADENGKTSNAATVTVDYIPVATNDASTSNTPGNSVTIDVTANDTGGDSVDPTTVQLVGADLGSNGQTLTIPGEGVWTVNPITGAITFIPEAGFSGDPTPIQYTVEDAEGNTAAPATVTVDYLTPPTAINDEDLGNVPGTAVTLSVLVNDIPGSGALVTNTLQIAGTTTVGDSLVVPGEGTWSVNLTTGTITFTPESGFTADPTPIQYTVNDAEGNTSAPATLVVDYLPVTKNDASTGNTPGGPVTFNVTANDTTGDTVDPTTVRIVNPAAGSTLSPDGQILTVPGEGVWTVDPTTGVITFTPAPGFTADPTPIQYTVEDGEGNTSAPTIVTVDYPALPTALDDEDEPGRSRLFLPVILQP